MTEELPSRYDHQEVEERIYKLWEESGYFDPNRLAAARQRRLKAEKRRNGSRESAASERKSAFSRRQSAFCIIMPPANANGPLHIGHAFEVALQDLMIRFWRMRGRKTLWLPGADHAGFETQVVFDKKLEKEGRDRFAIDRETLWKEIWDFTQTNKKTMENQLRQLGASCDWSREKFTLDPEIIATVYETFKKLYDDGFIYRDIRVVNWCPKHKTALSDLEVKYVERIDPLYYIKYGPLTLATVRTETKFGDTALAVNPHDKRYKKYLGKEIKAQGLLGPLKFKVIADEAVDPKFGTGVVKVTPAHDATDFEIWQRHKNEIPGPKIIINEDGRLTGEVGEFRGLKVLEARAKVAVAMKKIGILEKIDPRYQHQVATCYKCGTTLEPLPKPQWFVKIAPLAAPAVKAVAEKKITIIPKRFEKIYLHWLKNIRDWNISRQIVWGIRIPAWFKQRPKLPNEFKNWRFKKNRITQKLKRNNEYRVILNDEDLKLIKEKFKADEEGHLFDLYDGKKRYRIAEGNILRFADKKFRVRKNDYPIILAGVTSRHIWIGKIDGYRMTVEERWLENGYCRYESEFEDKVHPYFKGRKNIRGWEIIKEYERENNTSDQLIYIGSEKPLTDDWQRDPDVFDTWFSSGQWPFATLLGSGQAKSKISAKGGSASGGKNKKSKLRTTNDFKSFYPTDVMAPGYELIFFWVARMIMLGLYRTGTIPFKTVYLHGMVRDQDRQKMSKSKGNVIDPLGVAEIYGTDAVRMSLVSGPAAGHDPVISEDKIRGYRNFATKIWNMARFILRHKSEEKSALPLTSEDKKKLKELKNIKAKVTKHLEQFEFHLASDTIYHYLWHTVADKIIEETKPRLRGNDSHDQAAAAYLLETIMIECLKLLHPFMPFVTEEVYQKFRPGKLLMVEKWGD